MSPILFQVLLFLVCGAVCRAVAARRKLDKVFWFVMGVVFGPLAFPFVLFTNIRKV